MILLAALAAVALVLSAVGAYGVIAYSVTQRRQEIGVRIALGAQTQDIIRMVVREGLAMTAVGLAIGVPAALAATRLLGTLLYGIKPHDPLTFAGLGLTFAAVAFVASYLPARKATKVSPVVALRLD
jgi:ABC-type antimicrobial peptide transport system permease subunit